MTHLNFCRNNGKPAAVTSWGLGDVGGKLRLGWGGATWVLGRAVATPQHPPNDAPDWFPYSINVPFCPSTHPPTRINVPQTFRMKILHSPILSELLNPVKDSAFWWSMMTPKLSPKIYLHYHVWFVGEIGLQAKCLFLGWPRHVGEDYCPNISCTKSTYMPWKRKEVILKLTVLFKDLWVLFFFGSPSTIKA